MRITECRPLLVALLSLAFTAACSDSTAPNDTTPPNDATPTTGSVHVVVATDGPDRDADGYFVTVDGGAKHALAPSGSITIGGVPAGSREVRLGGVATNCTIGDAAERRIGVTAGQLATVTFAVTCVARVGSIAVSIATSGTEVPTGGYRLEVDGGTGRAVGANDTLTMADVHDGSHALWLRDLAPNCSVAEGNPQAVAVSFAETATAAFTVTCVSTHGTVQVTTATSGQDQDPDGYTVRVLRLDGRPEPVPPLLAPTSGTVAISVAPDRYIVVLEGTAGNCGLTPQGAAGGRHIEVTAGATVAISYAVTCVAVSHSAPASGGQLLFVRAGRIYRVNSDGTGLVRLTDGPADASPAWSPDGTRIAFASGEGGASDIYVMNADGSRVVRRTHGGYNAEPAWSPDGRTIAFASVRDGSADVYAVAADGAEASAVRLTNAPGSDAQPAWSPDGSRIAFVSDWRAYDLVYDLYVVNADGSGRAALLEGPFGSPNGVDYFQPAWSPDGRKLAVVSCPPSYQMCGTSTISVVNADGSGLTALTPTSGLARPTWSPDGRTIAFASAGSIEWVTADGVGRGVIVADGHSPAWRPVP